MDRRRALGVALVLISACAFGSGALFAKPAYAAGVGWHVLSSWRFLFGASLAWLWLLAWPAHRQALRSLDRRLVLGSLALGVLYVGNSATYFAGLETVDASLAALIVYVYPALVAVLTLRFGRRLRGTRAWGALGLALVGVILAVGGIDTTGAPPLDGLLLVVASPVIYAIWIVLAARLSGERGEAGEDRAGGGAGAGVAASAATALMMTATATTYWLSAVVLGLPVGPGDVPAGAWFGLVGVGVVSTFVAIQAFYAGTQRVGAAQAALLSTIEPVWTISLAAILLRESLQPIQLAGGALILLGVVIAQTGPAALRPPQPVVRIADE
ncbi:MAG: DMT family transporter [Chloroflexota bacterium]